MIVSVIAVLCSQAICHEEIVVKDDMSMQACMISQPALADWKAHSMFQGDQWTIARIKCVPGEYVLKDRI